MNISKIPGIYLITNERNNKKYIGASTDVLSRIESHQKLLNAGEHPNDFMQKDYFFSGDQFTFQLIEKVDEENLKEKEDYYIKKYNSFSETNGYNKVDTSTMSTKRGQDNNDIELGYLLKMMRVKSGLSQTELAEIMEISVSNVSRFESNLYEIKATTLIKWGLATNSIDLIISFIKKTDI